jgi:plastocyanin
MKGQWRSAAILVFTLMTAVLAHSLHLVRPAAAQTSAVERRPQTWHILVNNVSPEGRNWSFNAFYPDHLQAHPGDTIVFSLAPNPNAFHTAMVLAQGLTPVEMYQGFAGGFVQPGPPPVGLQSTFFSSEREGPPPPCGRAHQAPCPFAKSGDVDFGLNSGVLVNPPPHSGAQGNRSFAVTLSSDLPLGPYYFTSLVDGPSMSGRIDVLPLDLPVQRPEQLQADARHQYDADFAWLAGYDRISNPRRSRTAMGRRPGWSRPAAAARTMGDGP